MRKTYLEPMYKPFLEEDAAKYLDEHERQLVQEAAAFGKMLGAEPQMSSPSSRRVSQPQPAFEVTRVPAYEPCFAKYNGMTQEK